MTVTEDGLAPNFGARYQFHEVFRKEIALINERRGRNGRGQIQLEIESPASASGEPVLAPRQDANVIGLALSGGGIRSAAFCLGALQALHQTGVLNCIDYMSTVSGGGYIGCSLTAALDWGGRGQSGAVFPFASRLMEDETPSMQHVRNYSNYLFPEGAGDVLHNASIYARGLVANAVLVTPFLLIASALTLLSYSQSEKLAILNPFDLAHFFVSADLTAILLVAGILWGIIQSTGRRQREPEIPSSLTRWIGALVITLLVSVFSEAQPFVLDAMASRQSGGFWALLSNSINTLAAMLAPIATAMAFFASKMGEFVKNAAESSKRHIQLSGIAVRVAIYVAGLVVPLVIWVLYLHVTCWGLCIDAINCSCKPPVWLARVAHSAFSWAAQPAIALYIAVAVALVVVTLLMRPNSNSLHPLYRDRLAAAFLFKPEFALAREGKLEWWRPRLSEITALNGPYHLINAALNVQASKTVNRRGRNADFFLFSPMFVGSKSTDYVATNDIEEVAIGLDLATAMAVSGAAVSSNMGAESIKPLTATLALLNIRLGYWLRNPLRLAETAPHCVRGRPHRVSDFFRLRNVWANYYFVGELFGQLSERRKSVYLTDGGHVENLGIYELLRRRCRVIIAVDAEADSQMAFGSFNTLERYALIDLGIRIDLPWREIADESLTTGDAIDKTGDAPKHRGSHCAIGEISYPSGHKGILIYVKASLTGDESDSVIDYRRRYNAFPHETTLDQLFTEEQFETYRALGFHAAYGFFDRRDGFAHLDPVQNPNVRAEFTVLDRLFPRVAAGGLPRQKRTFLAWLPAAKVRRRVNQAIEVGGEPPRTAGSSED
jgi:hypothetical protein